MWARVGVEVCAHVGMCIHVGVQAQEGVCTPLGPCHRVVSLSMSKWPGSPSVGSPPHLTGSELVHRSRATGLSDSRLCLWPGSQRPLVMCPLVIPRVLPCLRVGGTLGQGLSPPEFSPQGLQVSPCLSHYKSVCSWLGPRSVGGLSPRSAICSLPSSEEWPLWLRGKGRGIGGSYSSLHPGWGSPPGSGASVI